MTLRSLDEWFALGSTSSDLQPGDRIIVLVDMKTLSVVTIETWPFRVVQAPNAMYVIAESLPKEVHGKRTVLGSQAMLVERERCYGPWRAAQHDDKSSICELDDCLDSSHYP